MFCKQCGKELADNVKFCKYCGAAQAAGDPADAVKLENSEKAGNVPTPENSERQKTDPRKKKGKGGIIAALVLFLLAAAAGTGAVLYFTGDAYQIKKNIKLAEECVTEGDYEEALDHYAQALKLDRTLVQAYLGTADIYLEQSNYQDAVEILDKGLNRVKGREKESLEEKREETYGLWVTALLSEEDYDGSRAVLDAAATVLDEGVLEKERQRIEQAQAGDIPQAQIPEEPEPEDTPQTQSVPETQESVAWSAEPEESYFAPTPEPEQPQFVLPDSDSRYLAMEELEGLTAQECRIARNELFARRGRLFKDEELQAYFDSCDWYDGWILPEDFDETVFNEYEVANRDLIIKYEKEQGFR